MAVCASTQMHIYSPCSLWRSKNLAAKLCLSAHPYDIIWHWSSRLLSPPSLLPLPSSSPPILCFQPGMKGRAEECQTGFCVFACSVYPSKSMTSFSADLSQYSLLILDLPFTTAFRHSSPFSTCVFSFLSCLCFLSLFSLYRQFQFTSGS